MLHSGLRTREVRRMKLADIDWEKRVLRVEQSKGLKDRLVPLSNTVLEALKAYLAIRGPSEALPDNLFIYRHAALSITYCGSRLSKYYGKKAGIVITPHQLRHSCATFLLNSGMQILSGQAILGHQHIDTTLGYARLYDGTVAADYQRAIGRLEGGIANNIADAQFHLNTNELLPILNSLSSGKFDRKQAKMVLTLRKMILSERGQV
jgi:integrase